MVAKTGLNDRWKCCNERGRKRGRVGGGCFGQEILRAQDEKKKQFPKCKSSLFLCGAFFLPSAPFLLVGVER